jgi:hypothetical protein
VRTSENSCSTHFVNRAPVRGIWNGIAEGSCRPDAPGMMATLWHNESLRALALARRLNFGELWLGEVRRIPLMGSW